MGEKNPDLVPIVKTNFYVYDLLTGASYVQEPKDLRIKLQSILENRGFVLRKWTSNSPDISCEEQGIRNLSERNDVIKILGIQWNPTGDQF